jgi:hypothetical protein
MKQVRQAELYWQTNPSSARTMTTYLDARPDLVEGVTITLKGSPRLWKVKKLYEPQDPKSIKRGWENDYLVKEKDRSS